MWSFDLPPTGRRAHVVLAAFGKGPLAEGGPMPMSAFGVPSAPAALAACDVRTIERATDPAWFDGWRTGSLRAIAERDLPSLEGLDAADQVHLITADVRAPADLGYLQTAWALARYLVARGAALVLDAHAMTFTAGAALPPADAELDVRREVRIVYETDSTRSDAGHALHTRGMRKFGAPDLVALCSDADVALVSKVIETLANAIARGGDLGSPRHGVDLGPGLTWYLVEDQHGLGNLLQLNNTARVLVDGAGRDLIGIAART